MPAAERLNALIAMVVAGRHAEAIEAFYREDATMQENLNPPRVGRATLIEHERRALARVKEVRSFKIDPAQMKVQGRSGH